MGLGNGLVEICLPAQDSFRSAGRLVFICCLDKAVSNRALKVYFLKCQTMHSGVVMSEIFFFYWLMFFGRLRFEFIRAVEQMINKSVFIPAYLQCALEVLDLLDQYSKVDLVWLTQTTFFVLHSKFRSIRLSPKIISSCFKVAALFLFLPLPVKNSKVDKSNTSTFLLPLLLHFLIPYCIYIYVAI